jgi:hypothetical protein
MRASSVLILVGLVSWWLGYAARDYYGSRSRDPETGWPLWAGRLWLYLASSVFFQAGVHALGAESQASKVLGAGGAVIQVAVGWLYYRKTKREGWFYSPRPPGSGRLTTYGIQPLILSAHREETKDKPPAEAKRPRVLGIVDDED